MKTIYYFTQNGRPAMLVEFFGIKFHVYFSDNEIVGVERQWYDVIPSAEAEEELKSISMDLNCFLNFFKNKNVYGHIYFDEDGETFQVNTWDNTVVFRRCKSLKEARVVLACTGIEQEDHWGMTSPFMEVRCI